MSQIPSSPRSAVLAWCQAHIDIFRTEAQNIGLTADQALTFGTLTETFATALAAQEKARIAAETATRAAGDAYTAMRRSMTNAVTDIRQFAEDAANPSAVYDLAQVPPRATPTAFPPPGQPRELSVELIGTSGALQLRWKSVNPRGTQGTSYIVRRRLPGETAFTFVGVTGERRFVDNTFVAGPDRVEYTVQAQRADSAGPVSSIFTINFGLPGPGRQLSVTTDGARTLRADTKLAA